MIMSLSKDELKEYVKLQMENMFPDKYQLEGDDVDVAMNDALDRTEECFKPIIYQGYKDNNGETIFSHLHSDQYATFLYFLGNSLWSLSQNKPICDKTMLLNRSLFTLFISYKCKMPPHFLLVHSYGTILGNAGYGDYLVVLQGVTINTREDKEGRPLPKIGEGAFFGAHSKVLGSESIGDRVSVGMDAMIYNQQIPNDYIVYRDRDGGIITKPRTKERCTAQSFFSVEL